MKSYRLWRLLLGWGLTLLAVLAGSGLLVIWWIGAWHILFPSSTYETEPPVLPAAMEAPAILVFTKTNQFRHKAGIRAGSDFFSDLGESRGWPVWQTENSAVFNREYLQHFELVVFLNATGNSLSPDQRQGLRSWIEDGGAWMGIHAAGDGSHAYWPWYVDNLIGVEFTAHILGPQFQAASVINAAPQHPVMQALPGSWTHTEEWYSWRNAPDTNLFAILASVDETSYSPRQKIFSRNVDLAMGYHPIAWTRCVGSGRALYSAMGHGADAYAASEHRQLLENATGWLLENAASDCR